MDELPGALGTSASLSLRMGQTIFSSAALLFMCLDVEFYSYPAFCWFCLLMISAGVFGMPMKFSWELYKLLGCNEVVGMAWLQQVRIRKYCAQMNLSFLVTVMGLVIPWSLTLALVDAYSVFFKCPLRQPGIILVIIVGDWVLSFLSLAAACSTAGVTDLLLNINGTHCTARLCSRYQLSAAMAFLSWFLSLASSLFNLWLLPSL